MKTILKLGLAVMLMLSFVAVQAQDKLITVAQLPKQAQAFLKTYGKGMTVSYVKKEDEIFSRTTYEVKMNDGSEVEFDKHGNWKEMDFKLNAVPHALIPQNIRNYVAKSFPNNKIVKLARKSTKYEVELSNGLDLEFDKNGKFLRIDD